MDRRNPPGSPSSPSSSTASILGKIETKGSDTPAWQEALISMIVNNLKSNYLFPDKINEAELRSEMTSAFRKRFSKPKYATEDGIVDKVQFAKDVTDIINNIIHDDHIYLSFSEEMIRRNKTDIESTGKFPWDRGLNVPKITSEVERQQREQDFTHDGCGFHEPRGMDAVEGKIPPNVAYIGLDYVADAEVFTTVREKAFEVMLKAQEKEAIIIDLRNNRGGVAGGHAIFLKFLSSRKYSYQYL